MIRTGISRTETRALQAFSEGQRIVECGALLGYSTLAIAAVAAHVISIDRHEGYGPSTLAPFLSNIDGHRDRISPVVGDGRLVVPVLDADRYFLDLDGSFENTRAVLAAIPVGRPVAIHDCNRQSCGGVLQAIRAEGYEISHVVETLAIIRRRAA
jgi:tRNA A58 N-methylase Trm61